MFEVSAWLPGLLIAGIYLWALFCWPLTRLRRKALAELRSLPTEELEKRTFQYPSGYFEYIGESHPSVVRFREIVEARDLDALGREWKRLERDFRTLEHQAGYSGRPFIMAFFHWYELDIKALQERRAVLPHRRGNGAAG